MKLTTALLLLSTFTLHALDTTEPFETGFTDNEVYVSTAGIGSRHSEKSLGGTYVLGAGITDRLSTILSFSMATDEFLAQPESDLSMTLFLNVFCSDRFKGDLSGTFTRDGHWNFTTELNLDFEKTGFQLTLTEGFESAGTDVAAIHTSTTAAPLVWWSVSDRIQLLTAVDFSFGSGIEAVDVGTAAFGCNIVLNSAIELITEVGFDIPEREQKVTGVVSVGILTTLPE